MTSEQPNPQAASPAGPKPAGPVLEYAPPPQAPTPKPVLDYAPPPAPRMERIPPHLWRIFGWMLWGDFVIVAMEQVVPRLVPRMLKAHNLSDTAIGVIMGTIPQIFMLAVMPFIAYRSDQLRTRWGRRIPLMLLGIPFVTVALCAIPYSPAWANWIGEFRLGPLIRDHRVAIAFGVTYTLYRMFDAVCSAGFGWLIPDVVPSQFMGRFQSQIRVVSSLALFVFLWYVFGLAENHSVAVFVGSAVVYCVGFSVVCFFVKEPPLPPPKDHGPKDPISILASYGRECFRHPVYVWLYAAGILYGFSQIAGNLYDMLFLEHTLKLKLPQMGRILAITTVAALPIALFCGHLLDRFKAQRLIIFFALGMSLAKFIGYYAIIGPRSYIAVTIGYNLIAFFWGVTLSTFTITMMPKDRFAQFAACGSVLGGLVGIVTPWICGRFFDYVQDYRYVYLWPGVLMLVVAAALWRIKLYWHALGGPDNYRAP